MNEGYEIWIIIIQVNGDYDSGNVNSRQIVGSLFNDAYDNRKNCYYLDSSGKCNENLW